MSANTSEAVELGSGSKVLSGSRIQQAALFAGVFVQPKPVGRGFVRVELNIARAVEFTE